MTSPLLTERTVGSLHAGDLGRTISIEVPAYVDPVLCSGVISRIEHEPGPSPTRSTTVVTLAPEPGEPLQMHRSRRWPSTHACSVM